LNPKLHYNSGIPETSYDPLLTTGKALGTLNLLLLGPTAAGLDDHLEARRTAPAVTSAFRKKTSTNIGTIVL
jgi:hypothetical protein